MQANASAPPLEESLCYLFTDRAPKSGMQLSGEIHKVDCTKRNSALWNVHGLLPTVRDIYADLQDIRARNPGRPEKALRANVYKKLAWDAQAWRAANGVFATSVYKTPNITPRTSGRYINETLALAKDYSDDQWFFGVIGTVSKTTLTMTPPADRTLPTTWSSAAFGQLPSYDLPTPRDVDSSFRQALSRLGRNLPAWKTWLEQNPAIYQHYFREQYQEWFDKRASIKVLNHGEKKVLRTEFDRSMNSPSTSRTGRIPRSMTKDTLPAATTAPGFDDDEVVEVTKATFDTSLETLKGFANKKRKLEPDEWVFIASPSLMVQHDQPSKLDNVPVPEQQENRQSGMPGSTHRATPRSGELLQSFLPLDAGTSIPASPATAQTRARYRSINQDSNNIVTTDSWTRFGVPVNLGEAGEIQVKHYKTFKETRRVYPQGGSFEYEDGGMRFRVLLENIN